MPIPGRSSRLSSLPSVMKRSEGQFQFEPRAGYTVFESSGSLSIAIHWVHLAIVNSLLVRFDFHLFVLNVETEAVVNAHVLVCNPYESEECDEVSPPIHVK